MTERTNQQGGSGKESEPAEADRLEHAIVVEDDRAECTFYPSVCPADAIVTHWITADESSHVPLANCR